MANKPGLPRSRDKKVTGQGKDVYKRGEGLGTGPVGRQDGYSGRRADESGAGGSSNRASGNRSGGLLKIVILAAILLLGGGGGLKALLSSLLGGSAPQTPPGGSNAPSVPIEEIVQAMPFDLNSVLGSFSSLGSTGWLKEANTGKLNTGVDAEARDKYTTIRGGGKDEVTVMVYMCGSDLESRHGLASGDISEMLAADLSDRINLLIYTGGSSSWRNSDISAGTNRIFKVENGRLKTLSGDEGSVSLTKPSTLSGFIRYCASNYPADRYQLIFWDHGGGSLSGFGYDENFRSSGAMSLSQIDKALSDGGVKFDIVGFDACLMATAENALMLSRHADYLIASEETEAGYGWYYTPWLNALSDNSSLPSVELGKIIIDDFVDFCMQKVPGQKATLSLVDLAELEASMPAELKAFADSTLSLIKKDYQTVSDARSACREFSNNKIDQVDLVNLALNMGSPEGRALADSVLGAVKYNRCSPDITNAYGLSIYFPYRKAAKVSAAVDTYEAIGMDDEYSRCIQAFAGVSGSAQGIQSASFPGSTDSIASLLGGLFGSGSSPVSQILPQSSAGTELIGSLLGSLLSDRSIISTEETARIIEDNRFDASALIWTRGNEGYEIKLSMEQWKPVRGIELNVFYDDGEGFIDLGLDNVFTISESGALLGDYDGSWLAVNGQPVAYYHSDTVDDGENYSISGRIPALLNGERVELIVVFDNANPDGYIAGAVFDYRDGETETVAKNIVSVSDGDVIDFLCDYYDYDGNYSDSYMLGDRLTVDGELVISNVYLPDASAAHASYIFTDIFAQEYWTPPLPQR